MHVMDMGIVNSPPGQNDHIYADDIFKRTLLKWKGRFFTKISLKFFS